MLGSEVRGPHDSNFLRLALTSLRIAPKRKFGRSSNTMLVLRLACEVVGSYTTGSDEVEECRIKVAGGGSDNREVKREWKVSTAIDELNCRLEERYYCC